MKRFQFYQTARRRQLQSIAPTRSLPPPRVFGLDTHTLDGRYS